MHEQNLNLHAIQEQIGSKKERQFRASDFLSEEDRHKIHENNRKAQNRRKFSVVDAYIAEILARFGYETFKAWNRGEISQLAMGHYLEAERARDVAKTLGIEATIIASLQGAQQPTKKGRKMPIENAVKILKEQEKVAKGEG